MNEWGPPSIASLIGCCCACAHACAPWRPARVPLVSACPRTQSRVSPRVARSRLSGPAAAPSRRSTTRRPSLGPLPMPLPVTCAAPAPPAPPLSQTRTGGRGRPCARPPTPRRTSRTSTAARRPVPCSAAPTGGPGTLTTAGGCAWARRAAWPPGSMRRSIASGTGPAARGRRTCRI